MVGEDIRIDIDSKQEVRYCIPLWLRDEQIRVNIEAIKGRIQPYYDLRQDPIAVVAFGPSLRETWGQVKTFKFIVSCSGAHKFLVERGIIPTWHVEVDPREHKIQLLGEPRIDVEYLIASTCHPKYMEHLLSHGANVKIWHVFSNEEEAKRVLPHGEWALMGGSSVGLRALTIARFLGFRNLYVFGMDGNFDAKGKHAAEHPNQPKNHRIVEFNGKEYETTEAVLHCAKETWHELDQMPDVIATFYGDGLVQEMAKSYKRKTTKEKVSIAYSKPELISVEYTAMNVKLHRDNLAYGVGGGKHAKTVIKLADSLKTKSILDYGSGKGYLAKAISFPIWEYDPAVVGKQESPRPADLVVCTDVLEHIEPDKLLFVLDDLRRCVKQIGFFTINTSPAQKKLCDGRNTHLIQKAKDWWQSKLSNFFTIGQIIESGPELYVIVAPKRKKEKAK